jgi:hypothetical protein
VIARSNAKACWMTTLPMTRNALKRSLSDTVSPLGMAGNRNVKEKLFLIFPIVKFVCLMQKFNK